MADEKIPSFEALKIISERTSSLTKDIFRTESIRAMSQFAERLRSVTIPVENMGRIMEEIASTVRIPNITDYIPQSAFDNMLSTQLSTVAFSELSGTSRLIESFQTALISSNYDACISAITKTLAASTIPAIDFCFLKTLDIPRVLSDDIAIPIGLRSSLSDLNVGTASRLAKAEGISYSFENTAFVAKDYPDAIATSKEMNVIASGADLFDSIDDEYISEVELMNFMTVLQSTLSHAALDPVGQKIKNLVERIAEHISFDCEYYYHSRPRDESDSPFTYDEMLTAPSGVTGPGRYNYPGQAFYYFADTIEGSAAEVKKHNTGKLVQTVKIQPNKSINMIDLSGSLRCGQTFLKYIRFPAKNESMPKAYLIPCFVSDCCRACNIDGIKYYGTKEYSNYVSWNAGYFDFVTMV